MPGKTRTVVLRWSSRRRAACGAARLRRSRRRASTCRCAFPARRPRPSSAARQALGLRFERDAAAASAPARRNGGVLPREPIALRLPASGTAARARDRGARRRRATSRSSCRCRSARRRGPAASRADRLGRFGLGRASAKSIASWRCSTPTSRRSRDTRSAWCASPTSLRRRSASRCAAATGRRCASRSEATVYDGASNLGAVRHDGVSAEALWFSDGLANYGAPWRLAFPVPVFAISSSASGDPAALQALAEASGGRSIDLATATRQGAADALLRARHRARRGQRARRAGDRRPVAERGGRTARRRRRAQRGRGRADDPSARCLGRGDDARRAGSRRPQRVAPRRACSGRASPSLRWQAKRARTRCESARSASASAWRRARPR